MAVVFARIRVSDIEHWRTAFLEAAPIRLQHGITTREVYRDRTYHNGLIVVLDADDLDEADRYYHSSELLQRMARSGVERPAEMWMGTALDISRPVR